MMDLVDDVLLERNLAGSNVLTAFRQERMNLLDDAFRIRSREDVTQHVSDDYISDRSGTTTKERLTLKHLSTIRNILVASSRVL